MWSWRVIVEYRHLLPAGSQTNQPSMSFPVEQSRAECATAAAWVLSGSAWAPNTCQRPQEFSSLLEIRRIWEEKLFFFVYIFISWLSLVLWEKRSLFSTLFYLFSTMFFWLWESLKTKINLFMSSALELTDENN